MAPHFMTLLLRVAVSFVDIGVYDTLSKQVFKQMCMECTVAHSIKRTV